MGGMTGIDHRGVCVWVASILEGCVCGWHDWHRSSRGVCGWHRSLRCVCGWHRSSRGVCVWVASILEGWMCGWHRSLMGGHGGGIDPRGVCVCVCGWHRSLMGGRVGGIDL